MLQERRRSERVRANLPVRWVGAFAEHEGTIGDISINGCFILSDGDVKIGELISLEIDLPRVLRLQLWGNVVNHAEEIGFALRFKDLTVTDQTLLTRLLEYVRPKRA
jgi:hypothetical protein